MRAVYREEAEQGRYCAGFELTGRMPGGTAADRFFPRDCLEHVAARGARTLIERGQLAAGDLYYSSLAPGGDSLAPGGDSLAPGGDSLAPGGDSSARGRPIRSLSPA